MSRRRELSNLKPKVKGPGLEFELQMANSGLKRWLKEVWEPLSDLERGRKSYVFWRQVPDSAGTKQIAEKIGRTYLTTVAE